uniref:Uncharacterized protein n=1 Tax=Lepeophtheirus salmonis TaxID=72036 RepID=A0A0K2UP35_LEPSM
MERQSQINVHITQLTPCRFPFSKQVPTRINSSSSKPLSGSGPGRRLCLKLEVVGLSD